jgi:hypothetical protein
MNSVKQVVEKKIKGLCYNNRLILPFKSYFLKVIIHSDIITDFSPNSHGIFIKEGEQFTDIYFFDYKNLRDVLSKYETIKMVVVEKGEDVFNFDNHIKLALYLEDEHKIKIEYTNEDILFIE